MADQTPIPETVRAAELASLLGVSPPTLSHLATPGRVVKRGTRYALAESIKTYCDHLRSPSARAGHRPDAPSDPLKAERIRQAREAADKLALQNASARGELLPRAEVLAEWSAILRDVRAAMLATPSRVGARLPSLTAHDIGEIDAEIRAALKGLAHGTE